MTEGTVALDQELAQPRHLAVCIVRRGASFLVGEGRDRITGETFYRPLGGSVEPGESPEDAAVREMREELDQSVRILGKLGEIDSRFVYEGHRRREIVHVYEAAFVDAPEHLTLIEEGWELAWITFDQVNAGKPLYPEGIMALISGVPSN